MDSIAVHPIEASTLAPQVDLLFYALLAFSLGLGIFLTVLVIGYAVKYRRGSKADRSGERARNTVLEVAWTSATALLALGIFLWGADLFLERDHPPADAIEIAGIGKQWMWIFEHANGRREINELHVPLGKPVVVNLSSEDVIHSMFVPAFRLKMDAVPGRETRLWFQTTRAGTYDLFCAEYCGTQHSEMRGHVVVMPEEQFAAWLAAAPSTASLVEQGQTLFRALGCSGCHGPSATVRAPKLEGLYGHPVGLTRGQTVIADDGYIRDSILQPKKDVVGGFEPIMPSFQGLITEDDLGKLVAYIKSLANAGVSP
ncbi:MAG TPA: cytochrome c oxidase subunit II [Devosia sp.]|nr:cytochrome c oxidase subunit II [Devosia sp.]